MSRDLDERKKPPEYLGVREFQTEGTASTKVLRQEYADVCEVQQGGQCVWCRVTERRMVGDEDREMNLVGEGVDPVTVQVTGRNCLYL